MRTASLLALSAFLVASSAAAEEEAQPPVPSAEEDSGALEETPPADEEPGAMEEEPATEDEPGTMEEEAEDPQAEPDDGEDAVENEEKRKSWTRRIVFYLPNRVLDVLDIARARARLGPGLAGNVRATRPASAFAGFYSSVYLGLPGPRGRGRSLPRSPVGIESRAGVQLGPADVTAAVPEYTWTEVGLGAQLLLAGADVGFDPWEVVDLVAGFFFLDPREDDF